MTVRLQLVSLSLALGMLGCATSADVAQNRSQAWKNSIWKNYSTARAYLTARTEAQQDIETGQLAYAAYGFILSGVEQLLHERYGIHLRVVGSCDSDNLVEAYALGYNEVMQPEIERRFGSNVWEQAWADAAKLRRDKQEQK